MKRLLLALALAAAVTALAALALVTPRPAAAQDAGMPFDRDPAAQDATVLLDPGPAVQDAAIPFETYHLNNGLRVILAPDPQATAVAVNLWYDVGSRHERPGRSGFGHLFEHLMFQGSENVERGEHMQLVQRAGGNLNASITQDRTNYFQTMPPERMNLALWLESERMRSLVITEENMKREVEVVKEERRQGVDNNPYGTSFLQAQFYAPYDSAGCFAYAHSVIGSMEDLDAAELDDVKEFFDTYYVPNNATLTVVGNFDPETTRELIDEYFGPAPRGDDPPEVRCEDPFAGLPVSMEIEDPNAQLSAYFASYGAVPRDHEDSYALSLLASILGTGETSRFHQRLVRDEEAAVNTATFASLRRGPGIVIAFGIANQGVEPERIAELLEEEIRRVIDEGVTEEELERAVNRQRANAILGRQTVMGRAEALQSANHFYGTPEALVEILERYEEVTVEDIQRVAATYLNPDNRAEIITRPAGDTREE